MPGHTQTGITVPRPAGRPSIRRVLYAVACAARRIRTARTPCAATGPCRFRARIPARLESGGVGIRSRDTPGRTPPHTRFRTHIFANNPRKRCHEALSSGLPVVFRRHESGVSFSAVLRKSGIITSEGRSWIQPSKSAGSNGAQARKGRCNAFEIIQYRKLNIGDDYVRHGQYGKVGRAAEASWRNKRMRR